jgi:hypothetical protein
MEQVTKIISDDEEVEEDIEIETTERLSEEDLQMMDNPPQSAQSMARVGEKKVNGKKPVRATRNKITKKLKRGPKNRSTQKVLKIGIVQVIERLVHIKEKEVNQEPTQKFSITKCMDEFKTLDGLTPYVKTPVLEVFKVPHNCEIFLNLVDDKDGASILWLHV